MYNLKMKLKTKGIIKMNISPVSYNTNNNKNKNLSFQMKMTPDTLEVLEKAGLGRKHTKMVQALLNHKDSDVFTAKIAQKGKEFILGLQHEKYNEAKEIFAKRLSNDENIFREKFLEYPTVELYERTPHHEDITTNSHRLTKMSVYNRIEATLSNVIESVHHEIFKGGQFSRFVKSTLEDSHNKNMLKVNAVHSEYEISNRIIKEGQKSGRFDENATIAIQEAVDKAYNGGKLHLSWPTKEGEWVKLENSLSRENYEYNISRLVHNPKYNGLRFTVIEAQKNDKMLYSYDPKNPEEKKYINHLETYLKRLI